VALEILVPTPAIRNLIREDKVHQIYSAMQTGQEKLGMQTMNQSLATLYQKRLITLETALSRLVEPDELQEMINRGAGVVAGAGLGRAGGARPDRPLGAAGRGLPPRDLDYGRRADMPTFAFSGRTRGGETVTGERMADTMDAVGRGAAARADPRHAHHPGGEARPRRAPRRAAREGCRPKNLAVFTRQFSVMIDAGLPLVQCLDILGNQEDTRTSRRSSCRRAPTSRAARRSPTR
jgi:hypothetical protein